MTGYCDESRPLLSAYLDGELPAEREATVRGHLEVCPGCRADLAALRELSVALAVRTEPDPSFLGRFRALRDQAPVGLPWPWRKLALRLLPLAAAAVLAASAAVWVSTEQNGLGELEARALGQLALDELTVDAPGFGIALEPFADEEP